MTRTMPEKTVIDDIQWFIEREGEVIATSEPFDIDKDRIQAFCRAMDNREWVHWDETRCNEQFGGIISPLFMLPALYPTLFFNSFEYGNINALFYGTDKFRLLAPVIAGSSVTATTRIAEVAKKDSAVTVYYDVTFNIIGRDEPAAVGTFLIRYW